MPGITGWTETIRGQLWPHLKAIEKWFTRDNEFAILPNTASETVLEWFNLPSNRCVLN